MPKRKSAPQQNPPAKKQATNADLASLWKSPHCFHHVLSFLDPSFILQTCSRVCSHWKEIIGSDDLWATLCRKKFNSQKEQSLIEDQRTRGGVSFVKIYFSHPWWEWRYFNGEKGQSNLQTYKQVWKEIEESQWDDLSTTSKQQVDSVAIETFNRVKQNMTIIEKRLNALKYPVKSIIKRDKNNDELVKNIEKQMGHAVPVLWKHFWDIIGEIDMLGWERGHCKKRMKWWEKVSGISSEHELYDNPLSINAPHTDWLNEWDSPDSDRFYYFISGDATQKCEISGGSLQSPMGLKHKIGFRVIGEMDEDKKHITHPDDYEHGISTTLITLFRQHILKYAGFPGIGDSGNEQTQKVLDELKKDLVEF